MTTSFKPFGLSEVGYLLGAKPRGTSYPVPIQSGSTDSFGSGEPVAYLNRAVNVIPATAYPPASIQEVIWGVFQSVYYRPSQSSIPPATFPNWISGTTTYNSEDASISVNTDPFVIYNVQSNGTLAGPSLIGYNFNLAGFGNLDDAGNSQVYFNNANILTENWGQVKLIGLAPVTPGTQTQGGNDWTDPYPIVQVVINNSTFKLGTYGG